MNKKNMIQQTETIQDNISNTDRSFKIVFMIFFIIIGLLSFLNIVTYKTVSNSLIVGVIFTAVDFFMVGYFMAKIKKKHKNKG